MTSLNAPKSICLESPTFLQPHKQRFFMRNIEFQQTPKASPYKGSGRAAASAAIVTAPFEKPMTLKNSPISAGDSSRCA